MFPHIPLRQTAEGTANLPGGQPSKNPRTDVNKSNRGEHGSRLKGVADSIVADWEKAQEQRQEEGKPLLEARRLTLQTDPESFEPDKLKAYGIEVISELENGYIIGASADLELTKLQEKIEKFINDERGGGNVAEVWELIDGIKSPEFILSPELWDHWDKVNDEQIYTIDVGIACLGPQSKLSDPPKRKQNENQDKYAKKFKNWSDKRDIQYQEWDKLSLKRQDELEEFISNYNGKLLSLIEDRIPESAKLPDSFSCRIQISGKGLKDLVYNFPYIFDVSEPDQFAELVQPQSLSDGEDPHFQLEPPDKNAPKVCVIDSGIQERHPLLKAAIDSENSRSWLPGNQQTDDYVKDGGHGTRVAGAVLYPRIIPRTGKQPAICWIQNARVLDDNRKLPENLFPPNMLGEIVELYKGARIFNHSITGSLPCRTRYMSAWAATIDQLTWQRDILLIVAAGNLPLDSRIGPARLSVKEHLAANRPYPDYLLEASCRIANPAQSFQALTVGSIAHNSYQAPSYSSIAQKDMPSAFSCSGLGIWDTIKPEVVEYGGDLVKDEGVPPKITCNKSICPELVRSTFSDDGHPGPAIASDKVGTSYAAPKVSHIAARLASELPDESCLLYRALIVQSARWPEWAMAGNVEQLHVLRQIGYGIPNIERCLGNAPNRIAMITRGERRIKARQAQIYEVKLPNSLRSQGDELEILVEVTLSYKAQPRRTRRHRRKYLSTWLDWDCSKRGEDPESFHARLLKDRDAPEDAEPGEDIFKWTLGKQKNHGKIKDVSRGAGTIQKDWTVVKSFELRESFCIAVVGHQGWNNDPDASVPYSLVVSFEAIQANVPIYQEISLAQVQMEVVDRVEIQSTGRI
ncbi:MAG: S8 family peptidase [Hormoscilla sp. GUM202]|nr:S8 family peptidase [Hormoscilla sp. GUM202]